jgi:hypothetical protein
MTQTAAAKAAGAGAASKANRCGSSDTVVLKCRRSAGHWRDLEPMGSLSGRMPAEVHPSDVSLGNASFLWFGARDKDHA